MISMPLALMEIFAVGLVLLVLVLFGVLYMFVKLYQKVDQGTALVRNGYGGTKVSFSGMFVVPILQFDSDLTKHASKGVCIERHNVHPRPNRGHDHGRPDRGHARRLY